MKYEYGKWYQTTIAIHKVKCSSVWKAPRPLPLKYHHGIDFSRAGIVGIFSATNGVVEAVRWDTADNGGFGLYVKVKIGTGRYLYYAHLRNSHVKVGQRIYKGDRLGTMGSTGNSNAQHLHFEYRVNGVSKDPTLFLIEEKMDTNQKKVVKETKLRFPNMMDDWTDEEVFQWFKTDGRSLLARNFNIYDAQIRKYNITKVFLDNLDIIKNYYTIDY